MCAPSGAQSGSRQSGINQHSTLCPFLVAWGGCTPVSSVKSVSVKRNIFRIAGVAAKEKTSATTQQPAPLTRIAL